MKEDPAAARDAIPRRSGGRAHALLAAALLAVTTLVRVPVELYRASIPDFTAASRDVVLAVFAAGLLLFLALAVVLVLLPPRPRGHATTVLVGVAAFAWIRSGFFPGPSVTLDGGRLTADLSTGPAGLLVPLAGGAFLAWLGTRQARIVTTFLAVLLGGFLVRSVGVAASVWNANPPASDAAARSVLEWSRQGNVLVLILDSLSSDVFDEVLETRPLLREQLDGFRYYRHASSNSPTTYLSLPTIHSGRVYDPDRSAAEFFNESIREHSVLTRFAGAGYRVSYAMGIGTCPKAVAHCVGTAELTRSRVRSAVEDASRVVDLGIYRVLPDGLRRVILEGGRGPLGVMVGRAWLTSWSEGHVAALERVISSSTVTDSPPTAKMIHTMMTHPPLVLQADCSVGARGLDRAAAIRQATCASRHVSALLERLRALGVYDVSTIVIAADHGYGTESRFAAHVNDARFKSRVGAFNPLVLVKPARSRGPLTVSDAPIELADLAGALCRETDCSPDQGLRRLDAVDAGRTRSAFWYVWKSNYWSLPQIPGLTRYAIRGDLLKPESWSREAAEYTPGTVIDFRRGQNSGPYRNFGWGRPQPTHIRAANARATLLLRARFEPARDYELVLEAKLDEESPPQSARVRVEVNGVPVGELTGVGPDSQFTEYRLAVPAGVLARSPETMIGFAATGDPASDADPGAAPVLLQTLELRSRP
jgi:hypothetical protein